MATTSVINVKFFGSVVGRILGMVEGKHALCICVRGEGHSSEQPYTARYDFCHRMRCGLCRRSLAHWFLSTAVCEGAYVQVEGKVTHKMCATYTSYRIVNFIRGGVANMSGHSL